MSQTLSARGAVFVRILEGVILKAYYDIADVLTIGVGFTWASAAFRKWWRANRPGQDFTINARMTRAECDEVLQLIFDEEYGKAVAEFFGREVPQHVFDGTASPVFNLGTGSLKWRWAQALKAGDVHRGAVLLRSTGTTINNGAQVVQGLINRRREEFELLDRGDYTIAGTVQSADPMADGVLRRRERGPAVEDLQQKLAAAGYYDQVVDGIFGYGTEAAVIEYQRRHGLTVDGVAGPKTLAELKANHKPTSAPEPLPAPGVPSKSGSSTSGLAGLLVAAFRFVLSLFTKGK